MEASPIVNNVSLPFTPLAIPEDNAFYQFTMNIKTPIVACILYIMITKYLNKKNIERSQTKEKVPQFSTTSWFKAFVFGHNFLLMAFSFVVFYYTFPLLVANYLRRPFLDAFCDKKGVIYSHGFGFWTWVFYVSKYYEIVDTAILLAKGKRVSFLQSFHHAGAIMIMWLLADIRHTCSWSFVTVNSFVHTVMYFYYNLTILGIQPKWKKTLTNIQITQFLAGIGVACCYPFIPGCICEDSIAPNHISRLLGITTRQSSYVALVLVLSYVVSLVGLFLNFSRKTYATPAKKND